MKNLILTLIFALIAVPAMAQEHSHEHADGLKPVKAEHVCMVNDTLFEKPQIPVEVDDKIYYGCCMGCVSRLKNDSAIRTGTDPVSGNAVDKATAIIGAMSDNTVYYFENEDNLHTFASGLMPEMEHENMED